MLQLAFARSIELGVPFNRHWTVHHERAGITNEDGAAFVGRLLAPAGRYCRRRDRFAAAWVRENGDGKGCHVHIAMHVPETAKLRGNTRRWIEQAGGTCRKGVSVVKVIGGTLAASRVGGPFYEANADVLLRYFLKGVDADLGKERSLELYGEGGLIIGKRAGRTQNLG
ncbi:hypothetical protein [Sphingomicrobium clamense]|uniref:Inovirus Gp2 family protein n=1 Tax=Sphingomicrobium clamense TaxID=2851013 RepID=A0ABS6V3Y5_9SPHN|nr:hypothetical protein [Sphingomicrobium sp. B8]MBW0143783.1 hypothetical protein [Sphingomicrobium sp. B8]